MPAPLKNYFRKLNRSVATKRLFDICASFFGILVFSPVLIVCGILIWRDSPGGIFFTQERVGQYKKPFRIFKLRTMRTEIATVLVTSSCNPRITRIGRTLRKLKLDEIPQLFNVLIGDMSIVGPRPEVAKYVEHYPAEAAKIIFSLKPGITDFASVRFADEEQILAKSSDPEQTYIKKIMPHKLRYCLLYARRRTLLVDLKIIFQTAVAVIK